MLMMLLTIISASFVAVIVLFVFFAFMPNTYSFTDEEFTEAFYDEVIQKGKNEHGKMV